jgi:hypothetical protein
LHKGEEGFGLEGPRKVLMGGEKQRGFVQIGLDGLEGVEASLSLEVEFHQQFVVGRI